MILDIVRTKSKLVIQFNSPSLFEKPILTFAEGSAVCPAGFGFKPYSVLVSEDNSIMFPA